MGRIPIGVDSAKLKKKKTWENDAGYLKKWWFHDEEDNNDDNDDNHSDDNDDNNDNDDNDNDN